MILVTGPTGSGKTTTLYSVLSHLNDPQKSITTVEEPVERRLRGICQTPVRSDSRAVFTFAKALRSILRQDPDIIMVGEIRDHETADIAIHAALTGHLVLTTLHTNDAPAAPPRLIDMGIEPYLVSSSVIGVLAQRLVRVLCPKCKEKCELDPKLLRSLGISVDELTGTIEAWRAVGCPSCGGQGYRGRLGVFELLVMTDELRGLVASHASADRIAEVSRSQGMVTMLEDAVSKVFEGITSIEEVMRVVDIGEGAPTGPEGVEAAAAD
jgi:type II secretory ATPase GspE/PulE/Tfp pilus assembly ATPase PilB-like protein